MYNTVNHFSEETLLRMPTNPDTGIISVTNPGRVTSIPTTWGPVLRLQFHDVDETWPDDYVKFSVAQADEILVWLAKHEAVLDAVYVHCAMGVSRSAGVAKFIADRYQIPLNEAKASCYNKLVYRTLWDRWTEDPKVQQLLLERR